MTSQCGWPHAPPQKRTMRFEITIHNKQKEQYTWLLITEHRVFTQAALLVYHVCEIVPLALVGGADLHRLLTQPEL